MLDIARPGAFSPADLRTTFDRKSNSYTALVDALGEHNPSLEFYCIPLVVSHLGALDEAKWTASLTNMGLTLPKDIDTIMTAATTGALKALKMILNARQAAIADLNNANDPRPLATP